MIRKKLSLLAMLLLAAPICAAQQVPLTFDMTAPGVDSYNSQIPVPKDIIGHTIGERHTVPHQVVEYFQAIANESDRVEYFQHGVTYEGRRQVHVVVTSPANHARLEDIRLAHLRLSDSPSEVGDSEIEGMPIVVYAGYSIHGNEASGTEAAILTLYHLAAGEGQEIEDLLENSIIIVDPMFNPDGRDRFADWANRFRGTAHTWDSQDLEHNEAWPGGRTNHYLFDLNRDWLPAVHPESQARLEVFHRWRPQILTDHHEMGSNATFFFQPGIQSRTNPNTPRENQELTRKIGHYHARALDMRGSLYYTEESFDDFYYGKGSTYPDINGAIGILFEQASSRALARSTQNGPLTYGYSVSNQFSTSLSTLEAAVELRTELLTYHRDFYRSAGQLFDDAESKAYVVSTKGAKARAYDIITLLGRHQIVVNELSRDLEAEDIYGERRMFEKEHAFVVSMNQRQARLIKALFERQTEFSDSLFYDVSTWTLPLSYGMEYAELERVPALGQLIDVEMLATGEFRGQSAYAYVIPWDGLYASRALYRLQEAGVRVRASSRDFAASSGGVLHSFKKGALIVWVQQEGVSSDDIREALLSAAEQDFVSVFPVDTGLTPDGPDLGTGTADVLAKTTVALVAGSGTSSYNVGEVWHLLSHRMRIPVSLIDSGRLESIKLDDYTVLVHAGGNVSIPDNVQKWVSEGGTLITLSSATSTLIDDELISLEERELDVDSLIQNVPYDKITSARGAQRIGGSILNALLDETHPIAYGIGNSLPLFRNSSSFFDRDKAPGSAPVVYSSDPWISGYVSDERRPMADGAVAVGVAEMGRGNIIYFADNPNFRGFWLGSARLFLNAVVFGPTL